MDRRTRSSDPYCVVTCGGGQHIRTPTIWRTLEPAWLEEYTIPVTAAFKYGAVSAPGPPFFWLGDT